MPAGEPSAAPSKPPAAAPSAFDDTVLLTLLAGDREAADEIAAEFLADVPQRIEALQAAFDDGDADQARREAHTIKGASANVGAEALREMAFRVERAAADGDLEAGRALMDEVRARLELLRQAISVGRAVR